MIFLILGAALVLMEASVLLFGGGSGTRHVEALAWPGVVMPLVVLAAGVWRWPREWKPVTLFAVALAAAQNASRVPSWQLPTLLALGIGIYLTWYGWQTRRVGHGERKGLLLFLMWMVIAIGLGWLLYFRR